MYGTFSGLSFGLVALVACLVVALALFASPLFAVIVLGMVAVFLLIGMSALRQRSERKDRSPGGAPDTRSTGRRARSGGEPASGEG
jgi:membrane protein implicated in regulation of membrane protease activity